jgi:hypothetical protein
MRSKWSGLLGPQINEPFSFQGSHCGVKVIQVGSPGKFVLKFKVVSSFGSESETTSNAPTDKNGDGGEGSTGGSSVGEGPSASKSSNGGPSDVTSQRSRTYNLRSSVGGRAQ